MQKQVTKKAIKKNKNRLSATKATMIYNKKHKVSK